MAKSWDRILVIRLLAYASCEAPQLPKSRRFRLLIRFAKLCDNNAMWAAGQALVSSSCCMVAN